jgi:signal transduction histidine kinase
VRLYRNGFRVLPYGEPDNDWLGLDETSRKRAVLPAIANINWIGFVEIRDPEGRYFEETSSREGLLRNHAYDELVDFVLRSFKEATLRVATARGRKGKAGKNRKDALPPMERLKEVAVDLEALAEKMQRAAAKRGDVAAPEASVLRDVARRVKLEAAASAELIQELAMLRVLSGLGLTIGMYSHEVSHRLLSLGGRIHELAESLPPNARTTKLLKETAAHVQLLESYTAYFDTAVSENIRRELAPQPLGTILWDFVRELKPILERDNIVFSDPDIREDQGLETRPMHPSEWTSILMNLLTNSVKAIRRNPRPRTGKLLLKAWREEATIFVDFADNGVGIPEKIHERIFDAFFTTTSDDSPDGLRGTGLGLKIVRDIVMAAGGQIYVTPPPASYSTCFRIEIPANPERRRK